MNAVFAFLHARLDEELELAMAAQEQTLIAGSGKAARHYERWSPHFVFNEIQFKRTLLVQAEVDMAEKPLSHLGRRVHLSVIKHMLKLYFTHPDYPKGWDS